MFSVVKQLAKDIEIIAFEMTLVYIELQTFRKANEAFAKRRKAKWTRFQVGSILTTEDVQTLIATKAIGSQESREGLLGGAR